MILQSYDLSELLGKIGVAVAPVKSGEHKDINSPFRRMNPADRQVLQALVDDLYVRFLGIVDGGRPGLSMEKIRS